MSLTPRLDKLDAGRNLIINGNFDFWQRGISANLTAADTYLADRFAAYKSAVFTGTSTYTRSSDVPTVAQSGHKGKYSLLITNGTGGSPGTNGMYYIRHALEGYDYAAIHSRTARLQFWVKSSITGTFSFMLRADGTRSIVYPYTINSANVWEKKTIDIALDTSDTAWLFDSGVGLVMAWFLSTGTDYVTSTTEEWQDLVRFAPTGYTNWAATTGATFQLAQVALYPGEFTSDHDLPFQRVGKTVGEEFAMCQRYYEKSYNTDIVPATATAVGSVTCTGLATASLTSYVVSNVFSTTKRGTPVVVLYNAVSGASGNWEALISNVGAVSYDSNVTMSTVNVGHKAFGCQISGSLSASNGDTLMFYGHYTADAEI